MNMKKDIRKYYSSYGIKWGTMTTLFEPNKRTDICFKNEETNKLTILNKEMYNKVKKNLFKQKSKVIN